MATQLSVNSKGVCSYIGIGLTSVGPTNIRAAKAESFLLGKQLSSGIIEQAAELACEDAKPASDPRGASAEYKKEMIRVSTKQALNSALNKATSGE